MFGVGARSGRGQAERALQIESARVVAEAPGTSTVLEARFEGRVLATVEIKIVVGRPSIGASVFGMDVDNRLVAEADLRGQYAGQEGQAADETWAEDFAVAGNRLGQKNAVEPILHPAAVFTVDMNLALALPVGIEADAGRLREQLAECAVGALRELMD